MTPKQMQNGIYIYIYIYISRRNFFHDSKADAEWRLAITYLEKCGDPAAKRHLELARTLAREQKEMDVAGMLRALALNRYEHHLFCEELKHLYTAVTRARVRLVIYEKDMRKRTPMFCFLKGTRLVEPVSLFGKYGEGKAEQAGMTKKTSSEEWRKQGQNLLQNGLYALAVKCFNRSGDYQLVSEATAQSIVNEKIKRLTDQQMRELSDDELRMREKDCLDAGEHFLHAGNGVKAANCFYHAHKLEYAAELYVKLSQQYHDKRLAARARMCLRKMAHNKSVSALYTKMGMFSNLLKRLRRERKYQEAISELGAAPPGFEAPPDLALEDFLYLAELQAQGKDSPQMEVRKSKSKDQQALCVAALQEESTKAIHKEIEQPKGKEKEVSVGVEGAQAKYERANPCDSIGDKTNVAEGQEHQRRDGATKEWVNKQYIVEDHRKQQAQKATVGKQDIVEVHMQQAQKATVDKQDMVEVHKQQAKEASADKQDIVEDHRKQQAGRATADKQKIVEHHQKQYIRHSGQGNTKVIQDRVRDQNHQAMRVPLDTHIVVEDHQKQQIRDTAQTNAEVIQDIVRDQI